MSNFKKVALCVPMLLLTALLMLSGKGGLPLVARLMAFVFANLMFILMVFTGKTYKYRAWFFITVALIFPVGFITHFLAERGSMSLNMTNVIECTVPFCHIVIPMVIIPAIFTKMIIFPGQISGSYASISSMIIIWLMAAIVIGRGWCSWMCFFGGWDEFFSKLRKKPLFTLKNQTWLYMPYAILFLVVAWSAYAFAPVYCSWLCPFKAVTEFEAVTNLKILIQTIIFVTLFLAMVIILPLLMKKRVQCGLFCPMGPLLAFFNKINIFTVRIDTDKCIHCKKCIKNCPLFAIDKESLTSGKVRSSCSKCGYCIDICPKKAIKYHIKGTPLFISTETARILFLYPAHILMSVFGGSIIANSLLVILNWGFK